MKGKKKRKPSPRFIDRTARLEDWGCDSLRDPYQPPEAGSLVLWGRVFNHPKKKDGTMIQSSRVVETKGRFVTTYSGTKYRLGRVSRKYAKWCKEMGIQISRIQPIKLIRSEKETAS